MENLEPNFEPNSCKVFEKNIKLLINIKTTTVPFETLRNMVDHAIVSHQKIIIQLLTYQN